MLGYFPMPLLPSHDGCYSWQSPNVTKTFGLPPVFNKPASTKPSKESVQYYLSKSEDSCIVYVTWARGANDRYEILGPKSKKVLMARMGCRIQWMVLFVSTLASSASKSIGVTHHLVKS